MTRVAIACALGSTWHRRTTSAPGQSARPRLFDDLIDRAGLRAGDRVIEIGCGTGQATVPLVQCGLAVTAIELAAGLAALARRPERRVPRPCQAPAGVARLASLLTATFVGYLTVGRRT